LDFIPVVNWIVLGYAGRVLKEAPQSDAPPRLEKYGNLFVEGGKIFLASLVYMLIPTILIVLGAVSVIGGVFSPENGGQSLALGGTGVVLLLLGIILAFVLLIILGVGIAHMVKTGKFGKAFAFSELFGIIRRIGWGKYIGWVIVTGIIAIVVGGVVGRIPYIGWLISAVVSPFLTVFIFRSLGDLYNDGAPAGLRAATVAAGEINCTACGTHMQPHHKFCPTCGAPAPVQQVATPTAAPPVEASKYCVSCGGKLPSTALYCGSCGAKQN
jgi:putative hemolysin